MFSQDAVTSGSYWTSFSNINTCIPSKFCTSGLPVCIHYSEIDDDIEPNEYEDDDLLNDGEQLEDDVTED